MELCCLVSWGPKYVREVSSTRSFMFSNDSSINKSDKAEEKSSKIEVIKI